MSQTTAIEWTDSTWSPLLGCAPKSAGCRECYATRDVWRMAHNPNPKISTPRQGLVEKTAGGVLRWTGKVSEVADQLDAPLYWRKPRRIFVANQADLFGEAVPDELIEAVFAVMAIAGWHTYQVLTKRPARAREFLSRTTLARCQAEAVKRGLDLPRERGWRRDARAYWNGPWPLPNVWIGTSIEDQASADERIPELLGTPAALRFLSCEPLLGPVDLAAPASPAYRLLSRHYGPRGFDETGSQPVRTRVAGTFPPVDWVIVGGETGHRPRPMHPAWARRLRDQCQAAGVPFFFKGWGDWKPCGTVYGAERDEDLDLGEEFLDALHDDGTIAHGYQPRPELNPWWMVRTGKKAAGRELDGRTHDDIPETRTR